MSLSDTAETAILDDIFKGIAVSWRANTDLWIALNTADPGESGSAISSEAAYGSYARVAVTRATGFTVSGNTISNTGTITFPLSTLAGADVTYATIVTTASGAGTYIGRAVLDSAIPTSLNVQPQFAAGALSFTIN